MSTKHPKYTKNFPAIDGIEKGPRPSEKEMDKRRETDPYLLEEFQHYEEAIRKDVEEILEMKDNEFKSWITPKRSALAMLLDPFESLSGIPDLQYSADHQRLTLGDNNALGPLIKELKQGSRYLDVIEEVRNERQGYT